MEPNVIDIVSYMKDLYAFKGRTAGERKNEDEAQGKSPYSFFDARYRDLATRWYKMKYMNPLEMQA
ncbi:MAG: hypothetical protein NTY36_00440 [Deltaproteobacteria bacterium]|nr:hypothetical protein [Deltaproteobacteria bacterium]